MNADPGFAIMTNQQFFEPSVLHEIPQVSMGDIQGATPIQTADASPQSGPQVNWVVVGGLVAAAAFLMLQR